MADTFPFAAGPGPDDDSGGRSRKALFVVLGGVLVLGLLGYFLVLPALSGGGAEPAAATRTLTTPRTAPKKAAPKAKAAVKPKVTQTTVYRDAIARDPFKALWYKPEAVTAQPAGTGTTVPPAAPAGSSTEPTGSATVGGQRVALISIFTRDGKQYAQTRVGDVVYTPTVGATFAGSYKLLAIGADSATYLFGDEQFSLREGQEVLK